MNAITPIAETADTITLSRADYLALIEAIQDAEDLESSRNVMKRMAEGEEEGVPIELVERLMAGESPVRVWREHRGMTGKALAESAGIAATYLSEIESGKKPGSLDAMAKLARALKISLDDLAPWQD